MYNKGCLRRASRAFTLVELVITIAIAAILVAIALPNFREFTIRMTVTENTNALVGALNVARSEAVKRGRPVALIANNGDWSAGWKIVAGKANGAGGVADGTVADPTSPGDTAADCIGDLDLDGITPLCSQFHGALSTDYTVAGKATGVGASDTEIVYAATGNLSGKAIGFDFSVCRPIVNADPLQSRWINVAAFGGVTSHRDVTSSPAGNCS